MKVCERNIVEVLIDSTCTESFDRLEKAVLSFLESSCTNYVNGPIDFSNNEYLIKNVKSLIICDIPHCLLSVPFWQAEVVLHLFTLNTDGSAEETLDDSGDVTAYSEWMLPCTEFYSLWDQ